MLPRLIFVLFTISFITYIWLQTSKADSKTFDETILIAQAVNDPKGPCKCNAIWICEDEEGNPLEKTAIQSIITYENECTTLRDEVFCNNTCETVESEEEKNSLCSGRVDRFTHCSEHNCNCEWKSTIN